MTKEKNMISFSLLAHYILDLVVSSENGNGAFRIRQIGFLYACIPLIFKFLIEGANSFYGDAFEIIFIVFSF